MCDWRKSMKRFIFKLKGWICIQHTTYNKREIVLEFNSFSNKFWMVCKLKKHYRIPVFVSWIDIPEQSFDWLSVIPYIDCQNITKEMFHKFVFASDSSNYNIVLLLQPDYLYHIKWQITGTRKSSQGQLLLFRRLIWQVLAWWHEICGEGEWLHGSVYLCMYDYVRNRNAE